MTRKNRSKDVAPVKLPARLVRIISSTSWWLSLDIFHNSTTSQTLKPNQAKTPNAPKTLTTESPYKVYRKSGCFSPSFAISSSGSSRRWSLFPRSLCLFS